MCQVRAWMRHQLTVCPFIDRCIRLFVRIDEAQIAQYYHLHQEMTGEPGREGVREQVQQLLVEQHVNARLVGLIADQCRKPSLEFSP